MKGTTLLFGDKVVVDLPEGTTISQKNRIENGYQKIQDHITEKDINGAIRDINGNPIRDKYGVPYQHYKEVDEAVNGLRKERDSLVKSIKNPNILPEVKRRIEEVVRDFDKTIVRWEEIIGGENHGQKN